MGGPKEAQQFTKIFPVSLNTSKECDSPGVIQMLEIPEEANCQGHKSVPGGEKAEDEAKRN